ncbi:hypothetical protein [Noviherbaspirillum denitrificans]|uniref:hypothetical protein n=1 Tax=Noviherbaspirillum denitrificans TaxID=1968433 RepID=UPI001481F473|nr:hypothetical protein [Noviherbaspirillum denitrificans]
MSDGPTLAAGKRDREVMKFGSLPVLYSNCVVIAILCCQCLLSDRLRIELYRLLLAGRH